MGDLWRKQTENGRNKLFILNIHQRRDCIINSTGYRLADCYSGIIKRGHHPGTTHEPRLVDPRSLQQFQLSFFFGTKFRSCPNSFNATKPLRVQPIVVRKLVLWRKCHQFRTVHLPNRIHANNIELTALRQEIWRFHAFWASYYVIDFFRNLAISISLPIKTLPSSDRSLSREFESLGACTTRPSLKPINDAESINDGRFFLAKEVRQIWNDAVKVGRLEISSNWVVSGQKFLRWVFVRYFHQWKAHTEDFFIKF